MSDEKFDRLLIAMFRHLPIEIRVRANDFMVRLLEVFIGNTDAVEVMVTLFNEITRENMHELIDAIWPSDGIRLTAPSPERDPPSRTETNPPSRPDPDPPQPAGPSHGRAPLRYVPPPTLYSDSDSESSDQEIAVTKATKKAIPVRRRRQKRDDTWRESPPKKKRRPRKIPARPKGQKVPKKQGKIAGAHYNQVYSNSSSDSPKDPSYSLPDFRDCLPGPAPNTTIAPSNPNTSKQSDNGDNTPSPVPFYSEDSDNETENSIRVTPSPVPYFLDDSDTENNERGEDEQDSRGTTTPSPVPYYSGKSENERGNQATATPSPVPYYSGKSEDENEMNENREAATPSPVPYYSGTLSSVLMFSNQSEHADQDSATDSRSEESDNGDEDNLLPLEQKVPARPQKMRDSKKVKQLKAQNATVMARAPPKFLYKKKKMQVRVRKPKPEGKKDIPKVACTICGKTFHNQSNLNRHTSQQHRPRPIIHTCRDCGKNFATEEILHEHFKVHAKDSKPQKCKFCGKLHRTRQAKNTHQLSCPQNPKNV